MLGPPAGGGLAGVEDRAGCEDRAGVEVAVQAPSVAAATRARIEAATCRTRGVQELELVEQGGQLGVNIDVAVLVADRHLGAGARQEVGQRLPRHLE